MGHKAFALPSHLLRSDNNISFTMDLATLAANALQQIECATDWPAMFMRGELRDPSSANAAQQPDRISNRPRTTEVLPKGARTWRQQHPPVTLPSLAQTPLANTVKKAQ